MQLGKKKEYLSSESKTTAYNLVTNLIGKSSLLMSSFLTKCMAPLMQKIKPKECWNYATAGSAISKQPFVGLRNLGCICYMNSMMQQFFMIPPFRYRLLSADDEQAENMQEYRN